MKIKLDDIFSRKECSFMLNYPENYIKCFLLPYYRNRTEHDVSFIQIERFCQLVSLKRTHVMVTGQNMLQWSLTCGSRATRVKLSRNFATSCYTRVSRHRVSTVSLCPSVASVSYNSTFYEPTFMENLLTVMQAYRAEIFSKQGLPFRMQLNLFIV